jgi:hypothetical protein
MDETTPLIPTSTLNKKNQPQELTNHESNTENSKEASVFSQSFYFSTPSSRPVPPPVADEDDEEEQVAFLQSDDDAEDSEEEDNGLESSDHRVTFAFEEDDEEEDELSYEENDDSEDASENGVDHELGRESSREVPQDRSRDSAAAATSLDFLPQDLGAEQATQGRPSTTTTKHKQRKVNQRVRKTTRPSQSSYNAVSTPRSTPNNNNTRRPRSHSFDTTNTAFTQNTALSEAIASVISHAKDVIVEGISEVTHAVSDVMHEEIKPVTPRPEGQHQQKLSAIALAVLVFYKVSGGPFGCEPAVRSAGNFWALIGFIFFPFVWALQEALVTAELGSAFPEPSGCKTLCCVYILS